MGIIAGGAAGAAAGGIAAGAAGAGAAAGGVGAGVAGALAGGALSAAGSIGGAAIGAGGRTSTSDPFRPFQDPLIGALSLEAMLGLGFFDPRLLAGASPLDQAIATINNTTLPKNIKTKGIRALVDLAGGVKTFDQLSGNAKGALDKVLSQSGFASIDELLQAEQVFAVQVQRAEEFFGPIQDQILAGRASALTQRADLISDLPGASASDLEALREQERTRLLDQLQDVERDALRQSNISGVNPGRQLSELDRFRVNDLELESLNRALGLLGGQQSLAGQGLGILDQAIGVPQQTAAQVGQLRIPSGVGGSQTPPGNPLAANLVAQGGNALGNAATLAGLLNIPGILNPSAGSPAFGGRP